MDSYIYNLRDGETSNTTNLVDRVEDAEFRTLRVIEIVLPFVHDLGGVKHRTVKVGHLVIIFPFARSEPDAIFSLPIVTSSSRTDTKNGSVEVQLAHSRVRPPLHLGQARGAGLSYS